MADKTQKKIDVVERAFERAAREWAAVEGFEWPEREDVREVWRSRARAALASRLPSPVLIDELAERLRTRG